MTFLDLRKSITALAEAFGMDWVRAREAAAENAYYEEDN